MTGWRFFIQLSSSTIGAVNDDIAQHLQLLGFKFAIAFIEIADIDAFHK